MLVISVTTSSGRMEFHLDAPGVKDTIDLHYSECLYCDGSIREEAVQRKGRKFCGVNDRKRYSVKGIGALSTASRVLRPLSV